MYKATAAAASADEETRKQALKAQQWYNRVRSQQAWADTLMAPEVAAQEQALMGVAPQSPTQLKSAAERKAEEG